MQAGATHQVCIFAPFGRQYGNFTRSTVGEAERFSGHLAILCLISCVYVPCLQQGQSPLTTHQPARSQWVHHSLSSFTCVCVCNYGVMTSDKMTAAITVFQPSAEPGKACDQQTAPFSSVTVSLLTEAERILPPSACQQLAIVSRPSPSSESDRLL